MKMPDNELQSGQCNTVEIVCLGEDAIHIVNGKVVMRLRGPRRIDRGAPEPVTSGSTILQAEGPRFSSARSKGERSTRSRRSLRNGNGRGVKEAGGIGRKKAQKTQKGRRRSDAVEATPVRGRGRRVRLP